MKKIILVLMVLLLVGCGNNQSDMNSTISVDLSEQVVETPQEAAQIPVEVEKKVYTYRPTEVRVLGFEFEANPSDHHVEITWQDMIRPGDFSYNTDEIKKVKNPISLYVMMNKANQLPSDFIPDTLTEPGVRFAFDHADEKRQMRKVAADALEKLFGGADEAGHTLYALSGYRSYNRQKSVYNYWVSLYGQEEADKFSARPGHSEHQTGLAMDITSESVAFDLQEAFGETPEGQWVKENAHLYGFIIRYPKDKTDITLYNYEPWHLRYVGEGLSTYLYEEDLTLEECFQDKLNSDV